MINLVLAAGAVSAFFGFLFLLLPLGFWRWLNALCNLPLFHVEVSLRRHNLVFGLLLIAGGGWIIHSLWDYPGYYLGFVAGGALIIAVGLLYLFWPDWMLRLSRLSDQDVLLMDRIALSSRFSLGIVLLLVSVYIFAKIGVALRPQ
ncbi:MAG: hypothetical protein MUC35_01890 [Candidatus Margulisbacteria bacterium]|jgi:hypothetical protein|nr:hypothetical protein [Candidatus Margulisiibacteriota bacterium]